MSTDLNKLLRWEVSGGTWHVLSRRGGRIDLSLCTCTGGEEVERFSSAETDVLAHVGERERHDDAATG